MGLGWIRRPMCWRYGKGGREVQMEMLGFDNIAFLYNDIKLLFLKIYQNTLSIYQIRKKMIRNNFKMT